MQRRKFNQAGFSAIGALVLVAYKQAQALSLGDLAGISNKDASAGLKTALEKGALAAVALLGKTDGFFGNDKVRIPLPGYLNDVAGLLKNTSVAAFFAGKTRAPLGVTFLSIVTKATEKVDLLDKYNEFAGKAAGFGLVKKEDANIQQYVTGKTLDGPYLIIGEEEKKICQDPVGTGSAILKKVFGALK